MTVAFHCYVYGTRKNGFSMIPDISCPDTVRILLQNRNLDVPITTSSTYPLSPCQRNMHRISIDILSYRHPFIEQVCHQQVQ